MGFPELRMRRLRENDFLRRLCAETRLGHQDLIYPLFVHDGAGKEPIGSMPGLFRHSIDSLLAEVAECAAHGINAVALFPLVDASLKDAAGKESRNPDGLVQRCIAAIAESCPQMGVIADVALDPYTDHGHDGLLDEHGRVDNDATVEALVEQSMALAEAGCRALAPSDMMDGRIAAIRAALEGAGWHDVALIAYSAKYASAFYGPFREAIGAGRQLGGRGKRGYQMDPSCVRQALREGELDSEEGADALMVKPAMPCLDIVAAYRQSFDLPIFAYQVSGEYAMISHLAAQGGGDLAAMARESLLAIKRAGADCILTYFALAFARGELDS